MLTGRVDELYKLKNIIQDTYSMAEQLGLKVNPKWSLNRFKEQHDLFSREILRKEYSEEPIDIGIYKNIKANVEHEGYKFELLESPLKVRQEGDKMRHCVGSYAKRCAKGEYVVYHVTSPEGVESTLGCAIFEPDFPDKAYEIAKAKKVTPKLVFQQHYEFGNKTVSPKDRVVVREVLNSGVLYKE